MTYRSFALIVLISSCGKSGLHRDAAVTGSDAAVGGDAAMSGYTCPVSGSTVTFRQLPLALDGVATLVTSPPHDNRLFALEDGGAIRVIVNEQLLPQPFLDISQTNSFISDGGEQGLLGLAFDPNYATNGTFYIFYTATAPMTSAMPYLNVLERYQVSATNPNVADPASGTILLAIPDPFSNHNGGMLEFGADGYLYVGTGDGGSAGDPYRNAQNPNALLGKFLRLDVDHPGTTLPYGIPADNPYANGGGAPEVFMLGLRNPWRWSFDQANGDLWIADVGQNETEEIDVLKAGTQLGANLGWSIYEGTGCCATQDDNCSQVAPFQTCNPAGITMPLDQRKHSDGWAAVIGGQVYRGSCYPSLAGTFFYTDYSKGGLSTAKLQADGSLSIVDLTGAFPTGASSIHAIDNGEIYVTDIHGNVYHLEAMP